MRISILIILIAFMNSCNKENYTTEKKKGNTLQKIMYEHGKITNSKTYKSGILNAEFIYDNSGVIIKMYQYYSNGKIQSYSYLIKKPNHYVTKIYHKNKQIASEGEGDYFKDKNLYLRRGTWIFYNTGVPYSIYTFGHDEKNEYIQDEVIFDTVKNKIIKEARYDPAVLYKK